MNVLQTVISYWLNCVKCEEALEQEFGITEDNFQLRSKIKAAIFEESYDPFIFNDEVKKIPLTSTNCKELAEKADLHDEVMYYGYPLLLYKDDRDKLSTAPLFIIAIDLANASSSPIISRLEPYPTLGTKCLEVLGLKPEEILTLNKAAHEIFKTPHSSKSKLSTLLELINRETSLAQAEAIDPDHLSNEVKITNGSRVALYNKAIIFRNEPTSFNLNLLRDLEKLRQKQDLELSALNYLLKRNKRQIAKNITPILPFKFDEYQLNAIQHILSNDTSLVTGPPGTGKSQFISNLVINLFFQGKKVLFVSHTGEAVRAVNERVNKDFDNLMMLTGRKEIRQELSLKLESISNEYRSQDEHMSSLVDVEQSWQQLQFAIKNLQDNDNIVSSMLSFSKKLKECKKRRGLIAFCKQLYWKLRTKVVNNRLSRLAPVSKQEAIIETLKHHHVEVCRSYVCENYLAMMFQGKNYGSISRFIDSIVNRKSQPESITTKFEETVAIEALEVMGTWSCTLKSLGANFPLLPCLFDYVIFDEASQIDLPSAAPALYRAKCAVVVGDPKQLNHISNISPEQDKAIAKDLGLTDIEELYPGVVDFKNVSLYKSVQYVSPDPPLSLLNHYRSVSSIAQLFNTTFYGGKLNVIEPSNDYPSSLPSGVIWKDISGTSLKFNNGSRYNTEEVYAVVESLRLIIDAASKKELTIGIVTPYSRQKILLEKAIKQELDSELLQRTKLKVDTVHRFQGSQADIIIFSTVIAAKGNGNSDSWYRGNYQILNVAISRARHLLVIVGDKKYALTLENSKYKSLVKNFENMHATKPEPESFLIESPYEKEFFEILRSKLSAKIEILPKLVVDGRFTLDFAIKNKRHNLAIELDGRPHEIIGGLPVPQDYYRDQYLEKHGWEVIRIANYKLIYEPEKTVETIMAALQ